MTTGRPKVTTFLTPELKARARALRFSAARPGRTGPGPRVSVVRGRGLHFTELREYSPGDEIKHIAWSATARTGRPLVKLYEEERQVQVLILADASASLNVGTTPTNAQRARSLASAIAWAASRQHHAVGGGIFTETLEYFVQPSARPQDLHTLLTSFSSEVVRTPRTDVSAMLEELLRKDLAPSLLYLISDFLSPPFDAALQRTARAHQVTAIVLPHNDHLSEPIPALLEIEDSETGSPLLVDGRRFISSHNNDEGDHVELSSGSAGVHVIQAHADPLAALLRFQRFKGNMRHHG